MSSERRKSSSWDLATIEEAIPRRLSSQFVLSMLDDFMFAAAGPLFINTTHFKRVILQMVFQFNTDNRRKFSFLPKEQLNAAIIKAVLMNDFTPLTKCKIDRSILNRVILTTHEAMSGARNLDITIASSTGRELHQALAARRLLSLNMGCPEHVLSPLHSWVKGYIGLYQDMNWAIITKYLKLTYHTMLSYAHYTKLHVDRNDLFNNMIMAMQRAIDKCDQARGTLTSYIEQWFLSAKNTTTFSHVYNVSYMLPPSIRRQMQKDGIPLTDFIGTMPEDDEIEDHDLNIEDHPVLDAANAATLRVLRNVKGAEIAFLTLGLPIILTGDERSRLSGSNG